jgi:hypothetical protein
MAHDLKQCVCCGSTEGVDAYHPDGLTVWLCHTCPEQVYPMNLSDRAKAVDCDSETGLSGTFAQNDRHHHSARKVRRGPTLARMLRKVRSRNETATQRSIQFGYPARAMGRADVATLRRLSE